jgi:hypothetical protein
MIDKTHAPIASVIDPMTELLTKLLNLLNYLPADRVRLLTLENNKTIRLVKTRRVMLRIAT